jgi:hypothetical protein
MGVALSSQSVFAARPQDGPFKLPSATVLVEKLKLKPEAAKKIDEIYASFKDDVAKTEEAAKNEKDKKKARKLVDDLKYKITARIKEDKDLALSDEQKKLMDDVSGPTKKKAKN